MSENQRNRGRILTPAGLHKLQQAIRTWEIQHRIRCTQEKIRELSDAFKEGGLDPGTIRKILEAKESVDRKSIQCLFQTFGLQLDEADWMTAAQGKLQSDPNFVGRDGAITDLDTLVSRDNRVIVIQARGGVGKTTLARKYLQQKFDAYLEFPIAKETKDIASIESLIEEKLRQLGEEPGREFFVSLDRLKRKLQAERIGILIDNLEPALDAAGKLIEPHRRYVELLRVLADPSVRAVTLITSRERLNEYSISMQHYLLSELSLAAWTQFFQNRFAFFGGDRPVSAADDAALAALHKAYGGNAKAMDILCGAVLTDYSGKLAAYWHANQDDLLIERALEDLVVGQFDRLQTLDPDAYKLLCRLGCYRYQDVPTVPIAGLLCLLWDVPENRQKRVVKALQDRSLVEFAEGVFWLHPVIRGEAIGRLRKGEDWETTNRNAAKFWTEIVRTVDSIEDALEALEAYYYYENIHETENAVRVITQRRDSQANGRSDLGYSCYRFGLINQLISLITPVIHNLRPSYYLSEVYFFLGDLMFIKGKPNQAIKYNDQAERLANIYFEVALYHERTFQDINIRAASLRNKSLYKYSMWELEEAEKELEKAIEVSMQTNDQMNLIASYSNLALLNSYKGFREVAQSFIKRVYEGISMVERPSWKRGWILIAMGKTHMNLGEIKQAFNVYNNSMEYAQESGNRLIKANCLSGLAALYREQNSFEIALSKHFESINISDEVGSISSLAEAYYQLGLTYKKMGEVEKGNESFQEAIRLFSEMEAPRQVERVRRSMQNIGSNGEFESSI